MLPNDRNICIVFIATILISVNTSTRYTGFEELEPIRMFLDKELGMTPSWVSIHHSIYLELLIAV